MKAGASSPNRVVFDTNILISAFLWKGPPRKALELARSGACRLVISIATLREFIRVLGYPKFDFDTKGIAQIVEDLVSFALFVPVRSHVNAVKADPSDNMFLSLAVDSGARYIVSGDKHLLRLRRYRNTEIVSPSHFVHVFHSKDFLPSDTKDSSSRR